MADRQKSQSAGDIRRDIEVTRTEMHETVEALERKLSVGQLVDELWGRVRRSSPGEIGSSVGDVVRDNPVPLALMGLGVAWLAVDRATDAGDDRPWKGRGSSVGPGSEERAEGRVGPYRGEDLSPEDRSALRTAKEKAGSLAETAKSKASGAAGTMKEKASRAADSAKETASGAAESMRKTGSGAAESFEDRTSAAKERMKSSASDAAERSRTGSSRASRTLREKKDRGIHQAREAATQSARQVKRGFQGMMEEQPLAVGALAFGLGLAGGLAAPGSRWEDRTMGNVADTIKEEAGSVARDVRESAGEVARDAARAASEEAERQDPVGDLKESAASVAREAKRTAQERAREEDLDSEGMKKRASEASERAGDRDEE